MRALLLIPLIVAPAVARAGELTYTPLVDASTLDAPCRDLAAIPINADIPGPALDAAISTASCEATVRTQGLVIPPTADAVRMLDDAVALAIRIFDRVIETGDPARVVIALYAKSDLYDGNADRIMNAVPHLSPQLGSMEAYEHYKLMSAAAQASEPLRRRAAACRYGIARVVATHPELATLRDPVVAYVVQKTRLVDAAGLARR